MRSIPIGGYNFPQLACPVLPPSVRMWVTLQARVLFGSRFGPTEHERLKQAVRVRFPQLSFGANGRAGEMAFNYIMIAILKEVLEGLGTPTPAAAPIQTAYTNYQEAVATIARMAKDAYEDAQTILTNLKA